jgi:hypothetical protein
MPRWATSVTYSLVCGAARADRLHARKADSGQTLNLQRDALLATGVEPGHLYEDQASGKRERLTSAK